MLHSYSTVSPLGLDKQGPYPGPRPWCLPQSWGHQVGSTIQVVHPSQDGTPVNLSSSRPFSSPPPNARGLHSAPQSLGHPGVPCMAWHHRLAQCTSHRVAGGHQKALALIWGPSDCLLRQESCKNYLPGGLHILGQPWHCYY